MKITHGQIIAQRAEKERSPTSGIFPGISMKAGSVTAITGRREFIHPVSRRGRGGGFQPPCPIMKRAMRLKTAATIPVSSGL